MSADKRFSITMSEELFQQVEQFRFANKINTQTKAVALLVQRGLDAMREPFPPENGDVALSDARSQLMDIRFRQLDDEDKIAVYQFSGYLLAGDKYQREKSDKES